MEDEIFVSLYLRMFLIKIQSKEFIINLQNHLVLPVIQVGFTCLWILYTSYLDNSIIF